MNKILFCSYHCLPTRDMLVRRLKRKGFDADGVYDIEKYIGITNSKKPNLILIDTFDCGGNEEIAIIQKFKALKSTKNIPIITLVRNMIDDEQKMLKAGSDDVDINPVKLSRLLDKINQLL